MAEKRKISLVLADVDGTLVTEEKVLTDRAPGRRAQPARGRHPLRHHQRPPAARAWPCCSTPLQLEHADRGLQRRPFRQAATSRSSSRRRVPADVAAKAIELIRGHGLDAWVYRGNDWLITKADAPHVDREAWTVKFEPTVVADVAEKLDQVAKIVGVSDDLDKVKRCEADAQAAFGERATANRSQPYYLDVTQQGRQQGRCAWNICRATSGVPAAEIATIGDQPNDVLMFKRSGLQHRDGQCFRRGQGSGQRHHGFLQRRRLRQGDGALHSGFVGLRSA